MVDDLHERAAHLDRYAEHSSRLQNWIGAYGAGLASMLVYQYRTAIGDARDLAQAADLPLKATSDLLARHIAGMHNALATAFLLIAISLAIQVALLFLNKWSQFTIAHTAGAKTEWSWNEKLADWLSEMFFVDVICDVSSAMLLGFATVSGIKALGLVS